MSNSPTEHAPKIAEPFGFIDIKELTALLIRREGLHQGLYEAAIRFTMTVANFKHPTGPSGPGVLSIVDGIGLSAAGAATSLTVDAAVVNPAPAPAPAAAPRKRGAARRSSP